MLAKKTDKKAASLTEGKRVLLLTTPVLIVAFLIVVCTLNPSLQLNPNWFYWHPVSMSAGVLLASMPSILIRQMKGRIPTKVHGFLMVIACLLLSFGWYVIHSNKNMNGRAHLVSSHGQLGAVLVISMVIMTLVSIPTLEPDYKVSLSEHVRGPIKSVHKWGGRLLMILSAYVLYTGFCDKVQSDLTEQIFGVILIVPTAALLRTAFRKLVPSKNKNE